MLKKRPHVIVVATGSRDSQSVLEDIKLSMRELEQENQMAPINVELVDHEVAEIFEKSSRAEVLRHCCISIRTKKASLHFVLRFSSDEL